MFSGSGSVAAGRTVPTSERSRWAISCAVGAALAIGFGLFAMAQAPQVPYADAWRFLVRFLSLPFPRSVLDSENGHLALLPHLVRWAELYVFAANQQMQTAVGMLLAVSTLALAMWRLRRESLEPARFWAMALLLALGLFWLGNFRVLTHSSETVHAYAVTLCLFAGLALASRGGVAASVGAGFCALCASLCFGSGLAVFPALLLAMALRRARWTDYLPVVILMTGTLALMLGLRAGGGDSAMQMPDVLGRIEALLRWLGGPALFASWPLWDPQIAAQVPSSQLRAVLEPVAAAYEQQAGLVMVARWPHLAWGLLGALGFAGALLRAWRQPRPAAVLGTALAAFALCVGAMIVLVRAEYFAMHPDQLLAPRYVAWSSLFWAGLGLVLLDALKAVRAAQLACAVFALSLPSQLWMYQLAGKQKQVAERAAVAAAVGVVEPALPLGETVPEELAQALPLLQAAEAAMFAWPETQWLDRAPEPARTHVLAPASLQVNAVDNRLGAAGRRVEFELGGVPAERLLLIDRDGVVRGLARREAGERWLGWMRADAPTVEVRVAVLREG